MSMRKSFDTDAPGDADRHAAAAGCRRPLGAGHSPRMQRVHAAAAGRHQGRAAPVRAEPLDLRRGDREIRRGRRRRLGAVRAEPPEAVEAADLRLRRRLGGDPVLGVDQQGHLQDRRGAGHRDHLLRPGVQAGEGGHLRRAALAAEAGFRHRLQLAVGRGRSRS